MPKERKPRTRKITPEKRDRIVRLLRTGQTAEIASSSVGVSRRTLYEEIRRGVRDDEEGRSGTAAAKFARSVGVALAEAEMGALGKILKAASAGQWQAAAWFLERRFPERYGRYRANRPPEEDALEGERRVEITGDE